MNLRPLIVFFPVLLLGCPGSGSGSQPVADASQIQAQKLTDLTWANSQFGEKTAQPRAVGITVPGPGVLHLRFLERDKVIWEQALTLETTKQTQLRLAVSTRRERPPVGEVKLPEGELPGGKEAAAAPTPTTFHFELVAELAPGKSVRHKFKLDQPGDENFSSAGMGLGTLAVPTLSVAPGEDLWLWTVTHGPGMNRTKANVGLSLLTMSSIKVDPATGEPKFKAGEKPLAEYPAPVWQLVVRFEGR
ncbi:MAG: hypothetical protein JKY65_07225 [Planctomycetes bacterium]|nr:hypothetical protein [Planctomycetota bacterium]